MKKGIERNLLYKVAAGIVAELTKNGFKAYFAGGFTRDWLLGRPIKDIDIATDARPDEVKEIFPTVFETGKAFGVLNLKRDDFIFEIATFREEKGYSDGRHPDFVAYTKDAKIDSMRRDFTINSMFFSPDSREIIDYQKGLEDLSKGVIRTVGDPDKRFSEDYLRILRAIRFSSEYGFEIEKNTEAAMIKNSENLRKISAERIRDELLKMLLGFNPSDAFRKMEKTKVLNVIISQLSEMRNTEQDEIFHPEGDVMEHTLLMLSHMVSPSVELALSVLFHDCGKPMTYLKGDDGRTHFYGHEDEGAKLAEKIMKDLRIPLNTIKTVSKIVAGHMRISAVSDMRKAKLSRFLCDKDFFYHLELNRIDCISSHKKMQSFVFLLDKFAEFCVQPEMPRPLINGDDLIQLGLKPGPDFKKILRELYDKQLEDPDLTKEELLNKVKEDVLW